MIYTATVINEQIYCRWKLRSNSRQLLKIRKNKKLEFFFSDLQRFSYNQPVDFLTVFALELLFNFALQQLAQPMSITMNQWVILSWVSQLLRDFSVSKPESSSFIAFTVDFDFFYSQSFWSKTKNRNFHQISKLKL